MGSLCTASPQQSTSTNAPPAWLQQAYQGLMQQAGQVAQIPFTPYSGEFTAPFNATQNAALSDTSYIPQDTQPYIDQATTYYGQAANTINNALSAGTGTLNQGLGIAQSALPYFNQASGYAA